MSEHGETEGRGANVPPVADLLAWQSLTSEERDDYLLTEIPAYPRTGVVAFDRLDELAIHLGLDTPGGEPQEDEGWDEDSRMSGILGQYRDALPLGITVLSSEIAETIRDAYGAIHPELDRETLDVLATANYRRLLRDPLLVSVPSQEHVGDRVVMAEHVLSGADRAIREAELIMLQGGIEFLTEGFENAAERMSGKRPDVEPHITDDEILDWIEGTS